MWYPPARLLGGLRGRLAVTYALVVLLSVVASAAYTTTVLRGFILDLIAKDLLTQANLIADDLDTALSSSDRDLVRARLSRIDELTRVRLQVLDRAGRPVAATTNPGPIEERPRDLNLAAALTGQTSVSTDVDPQTPNERVQATVPIRTDDGAVVGAVRAAYTLEEVRGTVDQVNIATAVGAALAALAAGTVGLFVAATVARPIRQVARAATRLAVDSSAARLPQPKAAPNEVRSLVASFNDLTGRLAAFERARSEFASDVSHELRSLASAMQTAAEALDRGVLRDDPARGERLVNGLVGHTHRLSRLAEDLLGLARLEGGRLRLELDEVDLVDVVTSVVDEWLAEAEQHGVAVTLETPPAPLLVRADAVRLVQAIGNLVENALKYAGDAGRIDLRVRADGDSFEVAVEDSGPGISSEARDRVFERYFRVEGRLGRGPGGMGLGLAIAHGIAAGHGGGLRVEQPEQGGARFVLRMPASPPLAVGGEARG